MSPLAAVHRLVADCRDLARLATVTPDLPRRLAAVLDRLAAATVRAEAQGVPAPALAASLAPVRELARSSPAFRRVQEWPRGYQHDFETAELFWAAQNREAPGTLAHAFEEYLLRSPVAWGYRELVHRQYALVLETLLRRGREARVLSLACGPGLDVRFAARWIRPAPGQLVLHDADEEAVRFARRQLGELAEACVFHAGGTLPTMDALAALGPFDLVLAGGLLDWLPDDAAAALLCEVREWLLAPGGTLLVTNAAAGHPLLAALAYLGDWSVRSRTPAVLRTLAREGGWPDGRLTMERDPSGSTHRMRLRAA